MFLCVVLNNDIIPRDVSGSSDCTGVHPFNHLTPPPWKHLNWAFSLSLFSLVSLVFFTESELVFMDTGRHVQ